MESTHTAPVLAPPTRRASPFALDDAGTYDRWRTRKLAQQPASVAALTVDIGDPRALLPDERRALLEKIARANFAVYRSPVTAEDKDIPRLMGAQLGLHRLDANWLADEDGISSIAVSKTLPTTALRAGPSEGERPAGGGPAQGGSDGRGSFIPYTDRPIRWHTDGYYHPAERRIRGMILHCVRRAASGGVNGLLDHELAYLRLRDMSPLHIRALMQTDVMTIPARADDDGTARPAQAGPVFSVEGDGSLHMRYTARTRSIEWKDTAATRAAVVALEAVLAAEAAGVFHVLLQPGMGIVGHNVLHDRSGFSDDPQRPRLLYRARFLDRVDLTGEVPCRNG